MAAQMFGNVGNINVNDATFNNAAGNQYNQYGAPAPGESEKLYLLIET
jgi:hypothetical protein